MNNSEVPPSLNPFATNLRTLREDAGVSLRHVSRVVGVSPTFISDIERGRRMPSRAVLRKIAEAIGKPAAELAKFDPRESLREIRTEVLAQPEMGNALAMLCRRLRTGQVSRKELEDLGRPKKR